MAGHWGVALGATLLYMAASLAPKLIPLVGKTLSGLITAPLMLGYATLFLRMLRSGDASLGMLFQQFHRSNIAIFASFLMAVVMLLWGSGGLVLGLVIGVKSSAIQAHFGNVGVFLLTGLALFLGLVPAALAGLRFMLTFFVLADSPEMGAVDAMRLSRQMMRGNLWKGFCLLGTFLGVYLPWVVLVATVFEHWFLPHQGRSRVETFCLALPLVWLGPYMTMLFAGFYNDFWVADPEAEKVRG